jgi:hypothetical protein
MQQHISSNSMTSLPRSRAMLLLMQQHFTSMFQPCHALLLLLVAVITYATSPQTGPEG